MKNIKNSKMYQNSKIGEIFLLRKFQLKKNGVKKSRKEKKIQKLKSRKDIFSAIMTFSNVLQFQLWI